MLLDILWAGRAYFALILLIALAALLDNK